MADHVLVDPFGSGRAVLGSAPLVTWDAVDMVQRVLGGVRRWADLRPERVRTRLWSTEMGLLLPDHPADLRHELGHCLARLGRDADAAAAIERYAADVAHEHPEVEERARIQATDAPRPAQLNAVADRTLRRAITTPWRVVGRSRSSCAVLPARSVESSGATRCVAAPAAATAR